VRVDLARLSPEVAVVVGAVREAHGTNHAELDHQLTRPLDAQRLVTVSRRHAATPAVHAALARRDHHVAHELRRVLDGPAQASRLRALALAGDLIRIVDTLRNAGVETLAYKGPVAAAGLYGDLAAREFVDLDLLVRPADVRRAVAIMEREGYAPVFPVNSKQMSFLLRHGHDRKFVRGDEVVEIQWAIAERSHAVPRDPAVWFERSRLVPLGAAQIRTLSRHDELLISSLHGALHLWGRLSWMTDMAAALAGLDDPVTDTANVLAAARRARVRRMFLSGPAMAARVVGTVLPRPLADAIDADEALGRTVARLTDAALGPDGPATFAARDQLGLRLSLKDTGIAKATEAVRAIATPTLSDWHAVRMPEVLWPLYYPLRLGRLVARYVVGSRSPGDWWMADAEPGVELPAGRPAASPSGRIAP